MSTGEAFSTGGNYSLESKLQSVRGKLSAVNRSVRQLESNMVFLLVNPHLVNYTSSQSTDTSQQEPHMWDVDSQGTVVASNPKTDFGQEEFLTNPAEIHGQYSDAMGLRHSLMVNEDEILSALHEEKKQTHNVGNNFLYDDTDTINKPH